MRTQKGGNVTLQQLDTAIGTTNNNKQENVTRSQKKKYPTTPHPITPLSPHHRLLILDEIHHQNIIQLDEQDKENIDEKVKGPQTLQAVTNEAKQVVPSAMEDQTIEKLLISTSATTSLLSTPYGSPTRPVNPYQWQGTLPVLQDFKRRESVAQEPPSPESIISPLKVSFADYLLNQEDPAMLSEIFPDGLPPINHAVLRALDTANLINNEYLRHDLIFDSRIYIGRYLTRCIFDRNITYFANVSTTDRLTLLGLTHELKKMLRDLTTWTDAEVSMMESVFDLEFIEQQMEADVFQPSSILEYVVSTLRSIYGTSRESSLNNVNKLIMEGNIISALTETFSVLLQIKMVRLCILTRKNEANPSLGHKRALSV